MIRPRKHQLPPYMTVDGRGGFFVRNPLTKKLRRFRAEDEQLARETAAALAEYVEQHRRRELLDSGRPTVRMLVERWERERLAQQPWDVSTRKTFLTRLRRIDQELGDQPIDAMDCLAIERWLSKTAERADPFNKWRHAFVLLWTFAVSQKLARSDEASKVLRRSTSRKIEGNRKTRGQLDVPGFQAIHARSPAWLQLAMELALITLQARKEVCGMRHTDFRDGWLYVIRDKVAADSSMAFIRIRVTAELDSLRSRARALDDVVSPYLVHRSPARRQRRWMEGKSHWTYINENYLTRAFQAARDGLEQYASLPPAERPTFHEIRGLGSRLHRARGRARADIQELMTHSDPRTTEIYLERGEASLSDDDYRPVEAPFTLRELLGR